MRNTTTPSLEGYPIREYLGVVTGEAILGINVFKDIFAGLRDIVGGRVKSYERELCKAREVAFAEMNESAHAMGGNAVVGIHIDYETLGRGGSMLMVTVTGTAVRI